MDDAKVNQWLDDYVAAWLSYDPQAIGKLFSEDALYYYGPYDEPVRGREAIVANWLKNRDEPGTYDGKYSLIVKQDGLAVANGRSIYYVKGTKDVNREFDNIFLIRFDSAGQATEFREWFMEKRKS
jgi:hypothetical protein